MAYVQPTTTDFLARYPEFSSVSPSKLSLVLQESIDDVSDSWIESDRRRAQMLLTAHMLTIEGHLGSSGAFGSAGGPVKSYKEGDVEVEFATTQDGGGAWTSNPQLGNNLRAYPGLVTESYTATVYGIHYLDLKQRSFPQIATA